MLSRGATHATIALLLISTTIGVLGVRAGANKQSLHVFEHVGVNIFLPVVVTDLDGRSETIDFILDTGTSRTTIDPSVAQDFGLRPYRRSTNTTGLGINVEYTAKIPQLCYLSQCSKDLEVQVSDLSLFTNGYHRRVGGLLAMDFLGASVVLIDFPNSQIGLFPTGTSLSSFSKWTTIELAEQEGLPLISVTLPNGKNVRLIFDTGFDSLVDALLYESATGRLEFITTGETVVKTVNGLDSLRVGTIDSMRIGKKLLAPATIQLSSRSSAEMAELDSAGQIGLFPFEGDMVALDYSNKKLFISIRPRPGSAAK